MHYVQARFKIGHAAIKLQLLPSYRLFVRRILKDLSDLVWILWFLRPRVESWWKFLRPPFATIACVYLDAKTSYNESLASAVSQDCPTLSAAALILTRDYSLYRRILPAGLLMPIQDPKVAKDSFYEKPAIVRNEDFDDVKCSRRARLVSSTFDYERKLPARLHQL